jgi:hypothetical protein
MRRGSVGWMLAATLGGAPVTGACASRYGETCAKLADCLKGNDKDADACEVAFEASEARADVRGCSDYWEAYSSCIIEKSECISSGGKDTFSDQKKCDDENKELGLCMAD